MIAENTTTTPDREEILHFIKQFKDAQTTFLFGCCYWFSHILFVRFGGVTLYEPIENHFLQKIGPRIYDVSGDVTDSYSLKSLLIWNEYERKDPLHYQHIVRDCILKKSTN